MEFTIKNIILYDAFGSVVGFAEFKIRRDRADIKVRHNFFLGGRKSGQENGEELVFCVVANGEEIGNYAITSVQSFFEIRRRINPEKEIFISISKHSGEQETLASGVINQAKVDLRDALQNNPLPQRNVEPLESVASKVSEFSEKNEHSEVDETVNSIGGTTEDIEAYIEKHFNDEIIDAAEDFDEVSNIVDEIEANKVNNDKIRNTIEKDNNTTQQVPAVKNEAVRELDEALRSICIIDENGKGQCETCPYRDHFFGKAIDDDEVVV